MEIVIPVIIVGIIGFIAGLGLSLASKFMSVPTDEKQRPVSVAEGAGGRFNASS